jgi:hypothetical protein
MSKTFTYFGFQLTQLIGISFEWIIIRVHAGFAVNGTGQFSSGDIPLKLNNVPSNAINAHSALSSQVNDSETWAAK